LRGEGENQKKGGKRLKKKRVTRDEGRVWWGEKGICDESVWKKGVYNGRGSGGGWPKGSFSNVENWGEKEYGKRGKKGRGGFGGISPEMPEKKVCG